MAKHGGRLILLNRGSLTPQKRSPQPATPSSLLPRAMGHPRQKGRMVSSCLSAPEFEYYHLLFSSPFLVLFPWNLQSRARRQRRHTPVCLELCRDITLRTLLAVGRAVRGKWEMWARGDSPALPAPFTQFLFGIVARSPPGIARHATSHDIA